MAEADNHVFICCERGDLAGWMEASWLADQGLDIWCEDGVNPGNPEWDDCADAILAASHCVFLVTDAFVNAKGAVNKLRFALGGHEPCIALVLEPVHPDAEVSQLIQRCETIDKRQHDTSTYSGRVAQLLGVELSLAPDTGHIAAISTGKRETYWVGEWRVYQGMMRIASGEESKTLDRKIFDVLDLLVQRAPQVVTIEEFLEEVWAGSVVEDNSLHRAISKLRKAFRDDPRQPGYIETIPRSGYRLVANLKRVDDQASAAPVFTSKPQKVLQVRVFQALNQDSADIAEALRWELKHLFYQTPEWRVTTEQPEQDQPADTPAVAIAGAVHVLDQSMRVHLQASLGNSLDLHWNCAWTSQRPASVDEIAELAQNCHARFLPLLQVVSS